MPRRGTPAARICGAALLALVGGCSTYLRLEPEAVPVATAREPIPRPLSLELVELRRDGVLQLVDESLATRIAMDLRQTRAFASVMEPIDAHRAPPAAVRAVVQVETTERQPAVNTAKAIVTGLSLFLLAPVFLYDYEARIDVAAALRTCDGWSTALSSGAAGSLRRGLFSSDDRSEATLRAAVLERALDPLVDAIARDDGLRVRSTAPCAPGPPA